MADWSERLPKRSRPAHFLSSLGTTFSIQTRGEKNGRKRATTGRRFGRKKRGNLSCLPGIKIHFSGGHKSGLHRCPRNGTFSSAFVVIVADSLTESTALRYTGVRWHENLLVRLFFPHVHRLFGCLRPNNWPIVPREGIVALLLCPWCVLVCQIRCCYSIQRKSTFGWWSLSGVHTVGLYPLFIDFLKSLHLL